MKTPIISVIVPVYNVEKYLNQCLDSILSQTFKNFEVVCVNDGSTDNSLEILEKYKSVDNRIVIVNKNNGGLSSARNTGLKYAKGTFISFIDSDDWIASNMLEKLYDNITTLQTDISMCAVQLFDEEEKKIKNDDYFNLSVFSEYFDNKVFSYKDTRDFTMKVPVMAWNKLYRRYFLESCSAKFPEGKIFEDGPFFFSIYFKTNRVSILRDFLYFYRVNRKGSILKNGGKQIIDIIDIVNLMYSELKLSSIFNDVKYDFYKYKIEEITYRYGFLNKKEKKEYKRKVINELCLSDKNEFDYRYIMQNIPVILYKNFCKLQGIKGLIDFYFQKFLIKFMYKIMQILYTDQNIFYIKLWQLKIRIKKNKKICDIWYENDKIYLILFNKIKFNFTFEYSKVEKKHK